MSERRGEKENRKIGDLFWGIIWLINLKLALKDERLIPRLVTDDREIERVALDLQNQR